MQYIAPRVPLPAELAPLDRRTARAAVFEQLRTWIEDGVLEPGETLKDGEIAERLAVSRTPVREALQMLERLGVVEMLPGRLTRVTPIKQDDVALLYAPLGALHATAAELGAPRATAEDIAQMHRHNDALLEAIESGDQALARDADHDFHYVLLRLADNPYLMTAIEPLLVHARRLEALYFRQAGPGRSSHEDHAAIVDAVEAGDVARAADLTRSNFTRYWEPPRRRSSKA
jgi:DNA-binding GntR family transcriptional regulator